MAPSRRAQCQGVQGTFLHLAPWVVTPGPPARSQDYSEVPCVPPQSPDSGLHHRPCHLLSSPTSTSVNPEICRDPSALWPQEGTAAPWGGEGCWELSRATSGGQALLGAGEQVCPGSMDGAQAAWGSLALPSVGWVASAVASRSPAALL